MFAAKKSNNETVNTGMINTLIGNKTKIEGTLVASEATRIDGEFQGKILSENSVIIGEGGMVKGDIKATDILVAGTVFGNLWAERRIELTETGRVRGDLFTKTLVIGEGASFKGNCTMDAEALEEADLAIESSAGDLPPQFQAEAVPEGSGGELGKTRKGNKNYLDEMEEI